MSLNNIFLSLEPDANILEFHANVPTLAPCPFNDLIFFNLTQSHIYTSPVLVPILICGPLGAQLTDVTEFVVPKSHNFVTLLV